MATVVAWSRALRACVSGLALALCSGAPACATNAPGVAFAPRAARSAPIDFAFPSDGSEVVSSATTRGRVTMLAFITTYDLASQIVARRVAEVVVRFTPRCNAAAVVMEAPRYAELLPAYRESLSLPYPVVMPDFATQQGEGPFGDITSVPVLVVLDRDGREVSRHRGPLDAEAIEQALRAAGAR